MKKSPHTFYCKSISLSSTNFSTLVTWFFDSRKTCCQKPPCYAMPGLPGHAPMLKNVLWDRFHPSEAANQVMVGDLLTQGTSLISWSPSNQKILLFYSFDLVYIIFRFYEIYVNYYVCFSLSLALKRCEVCLTPQLWM